MNSKFFFVSSHQLQIEVNFAFLIYHSQRNYMAPGKLKGRQCSKMHSCGSLNLHSSSKLLNTFETLPKQRSWTQQRNYRHSHTPSWHNAIIVASINLIPSLLSLNAFLLSITFKIFIPIQDGHLWEVANHEKNWDLRVRHFTRSKTRRFMFSLMSSVINRGCIERSAEF